MQANNRDAASLWDMVQAICHIQDFTASITYESYSRSLLIQRAVERELEILGEAARRISEDFQQAHAEIDWRNIIGLRNIISHRYDRVDREIIWGIISAVLPGLLLQLEPLLSFNDLE